MSEAARTVGRKIAIVGKAPSSKDLAPYSDPSWEIWGLGDAGMAMPRYTRWFELHCIETAKKRWVPTYFDWLRQCGVPVYMRHKYEEFPTSIAYPFDEMVAKFRPYFTNSISWMLALAIDEGVEEIALYGVDMAQSDPAKGKNGEYEHQRPSCEYFCGVADGRGIKLTIPPQSDLLKTVRQYARDTHSGDFYHKCLARTAELKAQKAQMEAQVQNSIQQLAALEGAMQDTLYWQRSWGM